MIIDAIGKKRPAEVAGGVVENKKGVIGPNHTKRQSLHIAF